MLVASTVFLATVPVSGFIVQVLFITTLVTSVRMVELVATLRSFCLRNCLPLIPGVHVLSYESFWRFWHCEGFAGYYVDVAMFRTTPRKREIRSP
nr:hypothetical protein CFP56_33413 [Quercus suber]